jgi:hypothetical protein
MNNPVSFLFALAIILAHPVAHAQTKLEQAKTFYEQGKLDQVKKMLAPVSEKDTDLLPLNIT